MQDFQVRGPKFKPRPGQKFGLRFLLHVHPTPPLGPHVKWILSLEFTCGEEERVERMGADTLVVMKKQERNPMTQGQKRRQENTKT